MITHDITIMGLQSVKKDLDNPVSVAIIDDAIEDIKKHAELERDVKRYFELCSIECKDYSSDEYYALKDKLMKVGKEE